MKFYPKQLIIGSIILFLLDFFILANQAIFPGNKFEGITAIIAFACAFAFIVGTIWAVFKSIFEMTRPRPTSAAAIPPAIRQDQSRFALTTLEIVFNRIFAVLLVLSSIPLLLNVLSLPTIIIFAVFALFLWLSKKYHPIANFFFFIIALGVYFVQIPPISWGFFRSLKEFRVNGFNFVFPVIFLIPLLIFVSFSVRNILGNIFACFRSGAVTRRVYFLITLIIVPVMLAAYPLLDSVRLRARTMNVNTAVGGDLPLVYTQQSLTFIDRYNMAGDFTSKFDPSSKKYTYHLQLQNPLVKSIRFTKVEADGKKIDFRNNSYAQCPNCQKDMGNPYGLVFPVGKDIDFIITSNQMIKVITFTELEDKNAEFVFWE